MQKWDLLQAHKDCCNTNIRRLAKSSKIRTLVPCVKSEIKSPLPVLFQRSTQGLVTHFQSFLQRRQKLLEDKAVSLCRGQPKFTQVKMIDFSERSILKDRDRRTLIALQWKEASVNKSEAVGDRWTPQCGSLARQLIGVVGNMKGAGPSARGSSHIRDSCT